MSDLALHEIAAGMFTQAELAALASGTEPSSGLRKPAAPLVPRRRRTYRLQQTPFRFRLARAIIHLEQARPSDRLDGSPRRGKDGSTTARSAISRSASHDPDDPPSDDEEYWMLRVQM